MMSCIFFLQAFYISDLYVLDSWGLQKWLFRSVCTFLFKNAITPEHEVKMNELFCSLFLCEDLVINHNHDSISLQIHITAIKYPYCGSTKVAFTIDIIS